LLDLLVIPETERSFVRLGGSAQRIVAGAKLPAPSAVFPRYVEPAGEATQQSANADR
jgi:methionyl-tRNA synthetase